MILTTHALVGAVIGKNVHNLWLIGIISLIVHFIMDHFRHGEYLNRNSTLKNTLWKIALDLFVGFSIIAFYIISDNLDITQIINIILGMFFSLFPDFLTFLYCELNFKFLKPIFRFHTWIHRYPPFSQERKWNAINFFNDALFSLAAMAIIFFF